MSTLKLQTIPALPSLEAAIHRAQEQILSAQHADGYWWYTLEANESIGSGFIQLTHFLGATGPVVERGLLQRMLSEQREDGSWALYWGGPGDLSTTVEAYFALRLGGHTPDAAPLKKARAFILEHGGLKKIRVFTRIHLALFGLIPWSACPEMPLWLILLPAWSGFSIYEFSSWARASIVPLLVIMDQKPVRPLPFNLTELSHQPLTASDWTLKSQSGNLSWENLFIQLDQGLKWLGRLPWHPGKAQARAACEQWIREHLERTEDIYPALAYGALALASLGYDLNDRHLKKAIAALKMFQQDNGAMIHQQCCISPLWDTPWNLTALFASGLPVGDKRALQASRYLIKKQITELKGDWAMKNPKASPGGWSFEFENDYFPDIDDTLQIIDVLAQTELPEEEKQPTLKRGLEWLLSMQSSNGGWAAFDKNNLSAWVNRIPFSDHGACLDPPTADITARVIGLLADFGYSQQDPIIQRALRFIEQEQEDGNKWGGRWGVNYLYGTWCVLGGLKRIGYDMQSPMVRQAVEWLKAVQCEDGGWGESCASYQQGYFVPLDHGVPSQTAWAVLGLIAAGETESESVARGIQFLLQRQREDGTWEEQEFTGTGFPGHFYIRYHGYCQYFPLLALGTYQYLSTGGTEQVLLERRVARANLWARSSFSETDQRFGQRQDPPLRRDLRNEKGVLSE